MFCLGKVLLKYINTVLTGLNLNPKKALLVILATGNETEINMFSKL